MDDVPLVHTTQLLPLNERNQLVGPGDPARQTQQLLSNLSQVLEKAGSALDHTVKLNIYLARADVMPLVQRSVAQAFSGQIKPAATFVVGDLPYPGALVALDAIATTTQSTTLAAGMPDNQGIKQAALLRSGSKVYVSGMADTNSLPLATRKTLEKLVAALGQMGINKTNIIQLKAFLQPMSGVDTVRKEIIQFFTSNAPPTVFVEWISPPPDPPIEIELIAAATNDFSKEPDSVSFLTPPGTTSTKVFSRVARVNHGKLIYFSGLYGVKAQDAAGQVREIFGTIGEVLKKTGSDFEHLVKATYYVSDDEASNKLNDIRPELFNPQRPPAASKAKVKSVGLSDKTVTIDLIAVQ